jgi:hypothetical protein
VRISALCACGFLAAILVASSVASATAVAARTIELQIGDSVLVAGTPIECVAARSDGKNGIGCVLVRNGQPLVGTFATGLAVDGTAVVDRIGKNASTVVIERGMRRARTAATVYTASVNDVFGIVVTRTVNLGCKVIDVTSTAYAPLYRGLKVSCWRATRTESLPLTWATSLSVKFAGVFKFDAHGNPTATGVLRVQP